MSEHPPAFDSQRFLSVLTSRPGVYRMLGAQGEVLYVGKAGNLKKRVSSYFRKQVDSVKTRTLVSHIANIEVTITRTETEALLLEAELIKSIKPPFNIRLRDDRSYPYIYIATEQTYPRISYWRGSRKAPGRYIGPFPHAGAIKQTLTLVQKLFKVRQCEDSYFNSRSRPCLQYQIKRCSGPCVGLIDPESYRADVQRTQQVLSGRNQAVLDELSSSMQQAAECLDYEKAAQLRDQIRDLRVISQQSASADQYAAIDLVALAVQGDVACVQVLFVRNGLLLGNKAFFPSVPTHSGAEGVLYAFLTQFYLGSDIPKEIILSEPLEEASVIEQALSQVRQSKVQFSHRVRGLRAQWLRTALTNAQEALAAHLSSRSGQAARLDDLRTLLGMDTPPGRMECFDISHTQGEATVASCVVFGPEGALKPEYRRFNIEGITPGDDYGAMRQALTRRYTRLLKEDRPLPDVLFIDGGRGQVSVARDVLYELQITDIELVGVAKGPERRAGEEDLIVCRDQQDQVIHLGQASRALHLIQQIRDEAHRFAITAHRARRAKARTQSVLEAIPGLGPKRRKALLTHFGGLQGVKRAGVEELSQVPGINQALAELIYDTFHVVSGR